MVSRRSVNSVNMVHDEVSPVPAPGRRLLRTCDSCKTRKVRCTGQPGPCQGCVRRKIDCHFSLQKPSRRPNANLGLVFNEPDTKDKQGAQNESNGAQPSKPLPEMYIDRLLSQAQSGRVAKQDRSVTVKGPGLFIGNYGLTFFSDGRLQYLSKTLQNNKVSELVQRISTVIKSRIAQQDQVITGSFFGARWHTDSRPRDPSVPVWNAKTYIQLYFDHVHPVFPFLDRQSFEAAAYSPDLQRLLLEDKAWSTLYYTVLAHGCQYHGGGSFERGKGEAWSLFTIPLSNFPELMTLPDSLKVLQAVAAMACYSLGLACLPFEHAIMAEAARRAQNIPKMNLTDGPAYNYHATFWIIYCIEKTTTFHFGRNSAFLDHEIVVPVPNIPDAPPALEGLFLIGVRYSRLLSRAKSFLFSAGVQGNSVSHYLAVIDQLNEELEKWRQSIPEALRPGGPVRHHELQICRSVSLWMQYMYNIFRQHICRATLHLCGKGAAENAAKAARQAEATAIMLQGSRSTLELTTFIDVLPSTPFWVLAGFPVTALFILFDQVIRHPRDPDTPRHLALLDIAAGHFSRLEYASNAYLPGGLVSEFAHIARDYANMINRDKELSDNMDRPLTQEEAAPAGAPPTHTKRTEPKASPGSLEAAAILCQPRLSATSAATAATTTEAVSQSGIASYPPAFDMDHFCFMPGEDLFANGDDPMIGTDIMDLFNSTLAGMDPLVFGQPPADQQFDSTET